VPENDESGVGCGSWPEDSVDCLPLSSEKKGGDRYGNSKMVSLEWIGGSGAVCR
jgi:hypothetical protein